MKEFVLFTMVKLSFMQLQSPPVNLSESSVTATSIFQMQPEQYLGASPMTKHPYLILFLLLKKNFLALFVSLSLLFQFLLAWLVLFWLVLTASLIFNFIPPTSTSSLINCLAVSSSSKVISLAFWLIDSCYLSKLLQSFLHPQLDPWRRAQN